MVARMTELPGLPPGTSIDIGTAENGEMVVLLKLRVAGRRGAREVVVAHPHRQMRALGAALIQQSEILDCVIPPQPAVITGGRS